MLLCTCIACLVSDIHKEYANFSGIRSRLSCGCCLYICTALSLSSNSYSNWVIQIGCTYVCLQNHGLKTWKFTNSSFAIRKFEEFFITICLYPFNTLANRADYSGMRKVHVPRFNFLEQKHVGTRYNSTEVKYLYFRHVLDCICT